MKKIYFDMDGTIYNLYGIRGWLSKLESKSPTVFTEGLPMVNLQELNATLRTLSLKGYTFGIITWLPKDATQAYNKSCTRQKKQWVAKNIPLLLNDFTALPYGVNKSRAKAHRQAIIVDDDARVAVEWLGNGGIVIDANHDIIKQLKQLIEG